MPKVQVFEELRQYVRFDQGSESVLRAFLPAAEPHFPRLAIEFYDRIREHEDAHAVFADEAQIVRLQRSMVAWLTRILSGPWDAAYIAQSVAIGHVHVRVGVPPRFVCSAMNLLRVGLTLIAEETHGKDDRLFAAIHQVLDLELATMIESYCVNFTRSVRSQAENEQAELTRSLELSERHYQQAVELAGMIVIGLDGDGLVRLFNAEAERTTGYVREDVEGKAFLSFFVDEDEHPRLSKLLNAALEGPDDVRRSNFEIRIRSKRRRWLAASVSTGLASGLATIIMAQDVTEARQLAEKSARAEKLAAVGTLAAGLAHEIRNPLNGAHLHLAYIRRELVKQNADADMLGAVSVVGDEIQRLSKLVTDFLQFARPRPFETKRVSLFDVVRRVERLLQRRDGVSVVADLPVDELVVDGDADQLEQLVLNLATNAVEALSETSNALVTLRLRRAPRHALLEVEDNGPGLSNSDAPIFDAFFTTKSGGTGLGLSIVHRIAQDHGGTVEVNSIPGRTVFATRLPLPLGES